MRGLTLILGALGAIVADTRGSTVPDKYLETIKVSDNIYVFKPKIDWEHGNGVAIIGPDGVFFIDTYHAYNYAEEAIRRLRRITPLPVRYIFNTHSHNDHTFGNGVFKRVFPQSRIIVQAAAVAPMDKRVREETAGQPEYLRAAIAQADSEIRNGRTGETPITGSMKPYWELSLREAREYQQQYRPEKYYSPDITFSDSLTIRWGDLTLQMIHMSEDGHSRSDAILWIPEKRLLVAGDLVVGPTPYYSLPGITKAVHHLIAMDPAIIIPGHGVVQYDLSYLRLLERAFSTYQQAAESALVAGVPLKDARNTISFPAIDQAFTGDDDMKKFTYRAFVTNNIFARTWNPPVPPVSAAQSPPGSTQLLHPDSLAALELENLQADVVNYRGRRSIHLLPRQGTVSSGWQGATEAMAIIPGTEFQNGTIEVELSGAPRAGAREGSRGFVGLAFRVRPNASAFETFYLRPTNGRADDQLRRNHAVQYQAFPDFQWDRLRAQSPGGYEAYADLQPGVWTTMRIVVSGTKARLYLNGAEQPALVVNDLKLGDSRGQIALWIGEDTEAYFSRVTLSPDR